MRTINTWLLWVVTVSPLVAAMHLVFHPAPGCPTPVSVVDVKKAVARAVLVAPTGPPKWVHVVGPFAPIVRHVSHTTGLPASLIAAVIHVESHGYLRAISAAGAIGPMQLMPHTAWVILRVNPWRAEPNIMGGARYLARQIRRFHSVRLALSAYNAGPQAVIDAGGEPSYTQSYVHAVLQTWRRIRTGSGRR